MSVSTPLHCVVRTLVVISTCIGFASASIGTVSVEELIVAGESNVQPGAESTSPYLSFAQMQSIPVGGNTLDTKISLNRGATSKHTMFRDIDALAMLDFISGSLIYHPERGENIYFLEVNLPNDSVMPVVDGVYNSANSSYVIESGIIEHIESALPMFTMLRVNHTDTIVHDKSFDNSLAAVSVDRVVGSDARSDGMSTVTFEIRLGDFMMMHTVNGTSAHAQLPPSTFSQGALTFDLIESKYEDNAKLWKQSIDSMVPVSTDEYLNHQFNGQEHFEFAESSLHYMAGIGQVANNYIHNMQQLAGKHDERIVRAQGILVPFPCGWTIPICCPISIICPICPVPIVFFLPALFCCII